MRRYELMLILRPDAPEDRVQTTLDRTTRVITAADGQIVKVSPWGRRRLAYGIDRYREGSYYLVVFDSPSEVIAELERGLLITEDVMRHLVTRVERPATARRAAQPAAEADVLPPAEEEEEQGEVIDESESEAAPAAIE